MSQAPSSDALELAVIAAAALGQLDERDLARVPDEALTGAARLFAWTCASRSCRILGRRSSFLAAHYVLVTAPRLDLPLDVWAALVRATDAELGAAEREGPRPGAVDLLLAASGHHGSRVS